MEKIIGGKRVYLDDTAMELFELAIMGAHTRKKLDNLVTSDLDLPSYTRPLVECFCTSLRKLPDALMAACCTLKYAVVAREMKRTLEREHLYIPKLVPCSHGILVVSTTQMHIVLQERTWALAANTADDKVADVDSEKMLDIDTFKNDKYYEYFKFVDTILENGGRVRNRDFLEKALPELVKACESENLLRWEMSRLFVFEQYSDTGEAKLFPGYITDINSGKSIAMQVFWTGKSTERTEEKIIVIDTKTKQSHDEYDKRKVYDYNVDAISPAGIVTRLLKSKALFKPIADLAKSKLYEGYNITNIPITGLMDDEYYVVRVGTTIAAGKLGGELKTLCDGASILNIDKNIVTIALDKQNQLNQVNIKTIVNFNINTCVSKTAAKLFSAL